MTSYQIAWIAVVVAGLGTVAGFVYATRRLPWQWLRVWLRAVAAVVLLLPAPIGAVPGYYAPAFVVALFEGLFQPEGDAGPAAAVAAAWHHRRIGLGGCLVRAQMEPCSALVDPDRSIGVIPIEAARHERPGVAR